MRPEAEQAFAEFVADCGTEIYKMPTSCEVYLQQYLARFDEERELLLAGLVTGVPRHILKHDGGTGYDDHLAIIAEKFATSAGVSPREAHWVVRAWAYAVGRPLGYAPPPPEPDTGRMYVDDFKQPDNAKLVRTLMAIIVTLGGFFGGVVGGLMLPVVAMAVDVATDYHTKGGPMNQTGVSGNAPRAATAAAVMIAMAVIGASSGLGALAGWLLGRGAERPWATFSVAFGTALATNLVVLFCLGPFLGAPIQFACVFGATFKSAARGGDA